MRFNSTRIFNDFRLMPHLILSLLILSIGISALRVAGFGLDAWGVLHEGISITTGASFGSVSVLVGLIILIFSLPLKIYPGVGTIANIILVGPLVDLLTTLLSLIQVNQVILLILGYIITNLGRALYISVGLGSGPRDALYVGISYLLKKTVSVIKPIIELMVILIGLSFGATLGLGILIMTAFSGYLLNFFFILLSYDTKVQKPSSLFDYIQKQAKI